ncbi:hypothetical protein L1277_000405 [Okibacterium sp. HSC-33S16]|uniref:hypothetical protein n=1 Tax=Okibacterium sp. HSC-33S16 TaxID=2910965 RepID=UPI00209CD2B8|nr:hypothetical protein [Okibacterium sp. HSC-33S16]MCP2030341.1 hypothetical protein [Okibacterium sp. HSC-33S16]
MYISDRDPDDFPPPQTIDDVARIFRLPLMSLIPQPPVEEQPIPSTTGSSSNGGVMTLDSVAISYTFWRNPSDRKDPTNLADLADSVRDALDADPVRPLTRWVMKQRELMRYPMLWEAVMTTRTSEEGWQTPESTLVGHVNHILTNSFRELRVVGGIPGELDSPVAERHIEAVNVPIDGVDVRGMRIDTDPHVYAVGAALDDLILTAVVAREHLPHISLAFRTRAMPSAS